MFLFNRTEGFYKGWYKAYSLNFVKGPISISIFFASYDYCKLFWQRILLNK